MTERRLLALKIAISLTGIGALVARLIWPHLRLDAISLGLLIVATLPWVSGLFESLEFPGGWKISFRKLETAAAAIPEAPVPPNSETTPSYLAVRGLDPALGLVGLRIEIERRLQDLAERTGVSAQTRSPNALVNELVRAKALPPGSISSALREIISAGNAAAHGATLPPGLEDFAFDEGPRILAWLDDQRRKG